MLLARAGLRVLLLDRHAFPRAKACGDCLSPNVTRLLERLGVLDVVHATGPARLAGWRIVSPGGRSFETRFADVTDDPGLSNALALSRDRLDAVLLDAARAAGADVRTGMRVTGLLPDGRGARATGPDGETIEVRARLTVGADGLRSVIARRTGAVRRPARLRKFSLTAHVVGLHFDEPIGEMHVADGLCVGIAPVTSGGRVAFNVSLVADADRYGRAVAADARAFFRSAISRFPAVRERIPSAALDGSPALLASGPFDVPVRRPVAPGLALVGDAAGYYDPFTGQGVNQAMEGAFLLAEEAARALTRDASDRPLLDGYARRLRARVRGPRVVQRIMEFVLSRPGLADRMIARLSRRPFAARALIAATGDIAPAISVFSPAVLLALAGPAAPEDRA
jgi:2-polyprenyl-6-methoxyphenol hydroxylase-like FAD-dependent oxidoreductase